MNIIICTGQPVQSDTSPNQQMLEPTQNASTDTFSIQNDLLNPKTDIDFRVYRGRVRVRLTLSLALTLLQQTK